MGLFDFITQPEVKVFVYACILVLLLIVLYQVTMFKQKEHLRALSYSAGADLRSMQQEFSGTNQRPYETGYNDQILNAFPFPDHSLESGVGQERFKGRREKSSTQIPPSQAQEEILAAQLYREHLSPDALVKDEIQAARNF